MDINIIINNQIMLNKIFGMSSQEKRLMEQNEQLKQ